MLCLWSWWMLVYCFCVWCGLSPLGNGHNYMRRQWKSIRSKTRRMLWLSRKSPLSTKVRCFSPSPSLPTEETFLCITRPGKETILCTMEREVLCVYNWHILYSNQNKCNRLPPAKRTHSLDTAWNEPLIRGMGIGIVFAPFHAVGNLIGSNPQIAWIYR